MGASVTVNGVSGKMIGTRIEHYEIVERLGQGGMGAVYRATDTLLEREVALKLLRPEYAADPQFAERFRAEAVTLAKLSHPNIATLYGFVRDVAASQLCMVMELATGETLTSVLKRSGAMSWERAILLTGQMLDALQYAHERGVVHRDIKPSNLMVGRDDHLKLMDFGIARLMGTTRVTQMGFTVGTLEYMAPEQIRGELISPATDLYAVGVLLYEAICGRRPFEGDDPIALAAAIREGRYERPASIAPEADPVIASVIERAMRSDPAARFADAEEMADALLASEWESDRHETVTMDTASSPPDEDGDATQAMQPMDRTAVLPTSAAEAAPESAVPAPPEPYQAPTPRLARPRRPSARMIAAVVIAIGLVVVLALVTFTGRLGSGPGRRPNATLPAPLEDALERLEDSVQP
jgi:serine/threonine protein kinase